MAFRRIDASELEWFTRPHEPDEPPRHVAELSELAVFAHSRANVWRYEPGARVYGAPPETEDERVELLGPAV